MTIGDLSCTYASLILSDDGIPITAVADKIATIIKAANLNIESYWPSLFAKLAEKRSIEDLVWNVGAGGGSNAVAVASPAACGAAAADPPPAEEKKEEAKEES